ncbi:MAG: tetratricopeptide repeat-containing glycosyltransferase family protein [Candidatus Dependentiae bacterium]
MKQWLLITILACSYLHANGDDFQSLFEQANTAFSKRDFNKATELYKQIVEIRQDIPQVYFNLGVVLLQTKNHNEAIEALKTSIALKNEYPKAYFQLGKAYQNIGNNAQAEQMYRTALAQDAHYFDPLAPLAGMLRDQNKFKDAVELYKEAIELRPRDIQVMLDLANTLNTDNQTEEALEWYFKLLELIPDNPAILYNIAYTLKKLNRLEDAIPYYNRTLTINPNHSEAHFSYGLALLLTGNCHPDNWKKGWEEYEWRWKRGSDKQKLRQYTQPVWDGSDLYGKTLFIWAEQGLGDTFEFVRYAKVAKDMGAAKVIVAVQKPLLDIISLCPYIDKIIWTQDKPPYFDFHAPMLSMPYYMQTRLNNVPAEIPYLYADPELVEEWKEILSADTNFRIGICWQGNPNYSTQFLRMAVAAKSMSITKFLPIMELPGVSVYSLQKMTGTDQLADLPEDAPLIVFGDDFDQSKGRFMDTAAVMKNLDLIITIDTSICHIAAGLGVPTWNLLPNPPDWRWMLDCDNTPWFGNMRLFRQPTPGDWDSVMQKVVKELKAHLYDGKPLITFKHPFES